MVVMSNNPQLIFGYLEVLRLAQHRQRWGVCTVYLPGGKTKLL